MPLAAAPSLLAATDRTRRDEVKKELEAEVSHLNDRLVQLRDDQPGSPVLSQIVPIVSALTGSLVALEQLVARRLETNDRIATLRRAVFKANEETHRLLSPWQMVMDGQISGYFVVRDGDIFERDNVGANIASIEAACHKTARALADMTRDVRATHFAK